MAKNKIRKIFNIAGIDIHRYYGDTDRLTWLRDLNIQTVFDIGANTGQFAIEIREKLPDAQIHSFEPIKESYEKLRTNFYNDKNFSASNYALGETHGYTMMNKNSYSLSSSILPMAESHKELFPYTQESSLEKVETRRLDDIFFELNPKENILIKVDTQGYEDKVIAGGIKAFTNTKVAILETSFIELYKGQSLFDGIYQKMKSIGFTYRGALHQKINSQTGEVIFEDSIFLRS